MNKIILQLNLYLNLITRNFSSYLKNIQPLSKNSFDPLISIYIDRLHIDVWCDDLQASISSMNDWMKGAIYSDIAFFYVINHDYTNAYFYFQKSLAIHPIIIFKYSFAYYETILNTQPSLLRFNQYLDHIPDQSLFHFFLLYQQNASKKNYQTLYKASKQYQYLFHQNKIPLLKEYNEIYLKLHTKKRS